MIVEPSGLIPSHPDLGAGHIKGRAAHEKCTDIGEFLGPLVAPGADRGSGGVSDTGHAVALGLGCGGVKVAPIDRPVLLAASVPLTPGNWTPLAAGELLVVQDGRIVARVAP